MITELLHFYLLDDKLLYTRKDFIGFNPTISKALNFEFPKKFGTIVKVDNFKMLGSSIEVTLTTHVDGGPIRGFKRIEIIKNGTKIIKYETGGKGFGSNYSEGNNFLVDGTNAYLVASAVGMRNLKTNKIFNDLNEDSYYFFWFTDVVVPTVEEIVINYDSVPEKKIYSRNEIQHLRKTEWHAKTVFNNHEIIISESIIPGFWRIKWDSNGYEEFVKSEQRLESRETKFTVDGIDEVY